MTAKEILRDYLEKEEMEVDSLGFGELFLSRLCGG